MFLEGLFLSELNRFLKHDDEEANSDCRPAELCKSAKRNIRQAQKRVKKMQPTSQPVIVDAAAGKNYFNMMVGIFSCLTKARGGERGFYLLDRSRFLSVFEQGMLQGWHPKWIKMLLKTCNSKPHLGKAFGDAMSLNILQRVLPRMLHCVGLLAELPDDKWARPPDMAQCRRHCMTLDADCREWKKVTFAESVIVVMFWCIAASAELHKSYTMCIDCGMRFLVGFGLAGT